MEPRVVEAVHSSNTCCLAPVIDKCTIALGDEKQAFDIVGSTGGEVVFQIAYLREWG